MLPGERNREFALSHKAEKGYLEKAPQPLRDIALLILSTGLRIGEALALKAKTCTLSRWEMHCAGICGFETGNRGLLGGTSL